MKEKHYNVCIYGYLFISIEKAYLQNDRVKMREGLFYNLTVNITRKIKM